MDCFFPIQKIFTKNHAKNVLKRSLFFILIFFSLFHDIVDLLRCCGINRGSLRSRSDSHSVPGGYREVLMSVSDYGSL